MGMDDAGIGVLKKLDDAPEGAWVGDFGCTPREALAWIAQTKIVRDMIARAIAPTHYRAALILADMILDGHGDRAGSYVDVWTGDPGAEGAAILMSGWAPDDPEFNSVLNGYCRAAEAGGFMDGSRDRLIEAYARRFKADADAYADIRDALTDLGLMPAVMDSEAL